MRLVVVEILGVLSHPVALSTLVIFSVLMILSIVETRPG
jgi:hypothetical protein